MPAFAALNQATFPGTSTAEFLAASTSAGVHAVELRPLGRNESIAAMASAVREAGVRVFAVNALMDWALPDDPDPVPTLESLIEAAVAVGAPWIVCVAPLRAQGFPAPEEMVCRAGERLTTLAAIAARAGVRLALEQVGRSSTRSDVYSCIPQLRDARAIVAQTPDVGLVIDSYNVATADVDFAEIADVPRARLAIAHVADLDRDTGRRCLPGYGVLDLTAFVHALDGAGYDGPVSLELFPETPWPDPRAFARAAAEALGRLLAGNEPT
jgi:sugar phosphate isomerase/epimerase